MKRTANVVTAVGAVIASLGVFAVAFSGAVQGVAFFGALLIGVGPVVAALGKILRREPIEGVGFLVFSFGTVCGVPAILGIIRGVTVPLSHDVELLVGIGSALCGGALFQSAVGKFRSISRYVERSYPVFGLGAILAGVGCLVFTLRSGAGRSSGLSSGVLLTGLIGGIGLGLAASGVALAKTLRGHIYVAPGTRTRPVLVWVFSQKTFSRVFEPVLAETTNEWLEAQAASRPWQARWIMLRGWLLLAQNIALQLPVSTVKIILKAWMLHP